MHNDGYSCGLVAFPQLPRPLTVRRLRRSKLPTALLAISLMLASPLVAAAQTLSLRIGAGHPTPALAYVEAHDTYFIPEVKRRAAEKGFTVNFTTAWAGTIAKVDGMVEAVQAGILDIGLASPTFEPTRLGLLGFANSVPFVSPDPLFMAKVLNRLVGEEPALKKSLDRYKAELLSVHVTENYGISLKRPVTKPEDLAGRKIGGGAVNAPWRTAMGATPMTMAAPDAYQAMQTNLAEGLVFFFSGANSFRLYEVAPVWYKADFGSIPGSVTIMNKASRQRLPADVVAIIDTVAQETALKIAEINKRRDLTTAKTLGDKVEVIQISDADKSRWATLMKDLPKKWAQDLDGRGAAGSAVMRAYLSILESEGFRTPVDYKF